MFRDSIIQLRVHKIVFRIIILVLFALSLQSCIIYNAAKHAKGNICQIHNINMRKGIVHTHYGIAGIRNSNQYPNAKIKKSMGCDRPLWPIHRLALIYYCSHCEGLKNEKN